MEEWWLIMSKAAMSRRDSGVTGSERGRESKGGR